MWDGGEECVGGRKDEGLCGREEGKVWKGEWEGVGERRGVCGRERRGVCGKEEGSVGGRREEGSVWEGGGRREVCGTMKRSVEKRRGVWKGGGEHMGQRMGRYGKEREGCGTEEGEVWK